MTSGQGSGARLEVESLARAHIGAINRHSVDEVVSSVADNVCYQVFPGGGKKKGMAELRGYWTETFKRIPDIYFTVEALMKNDETSQVFVRGRLTGIDGSPYCLAPDDHLVREELGINFRFDSSGRIAEVVSFYEALGLDLYELARDHIERENRIDLPPIERAERSMETVADDACYVIYPTGQEIRGKNEIFKYYKDSFEGIPDLHIDIQHMAKDEGKRQVLCQYRITGVNKGDMQGLLPTNRRIEFYGAIIYKFNEAGKLTREMNYFEQTDVLAAMGLIRSTRTPFGMLLLIFPQSPIYTLRLILSKLFARGGANQSIGDS